MNAYLRRVFPSKFYARPAYFGAFWLGVVMVLLSVAQLFGMEKYQAVFETWGLAGGAFTAAILAGLLPLLEIASVPYLVSMKLPQPMLDFGRFATVAVGAFWFFGEIYAAWSAGGASAAVFGAEIPMLAGWVTVLFGLFLFAACLLATSVLRSRTS